MPYKNKNKQKKAQQQHYLANKQLYLSRRKIRTDEAIAFVNSYKQREDVVCVNCGEGRWQCLEFHHRDPKTKYKGIAVMVRNGSSIEKILLEIAKCDVLCANCHKIHHNNNVWTESSYQVV